MRISNEIKIAYYKWAKTMAETPEYWEEGYKKADEKQKRYYKAFIKECEKLNLYHIEVAKELI